MTVILPAECKCFSLLGKFVHMFADSELLEGIKALVAGFMLTNNLLNLEACTPEVVDCLLYTSPSPRDKRQSRMPSSA